MSNVSGTTSDANVEEQFSPECRRRLGYHPVVSEAQRAFYEENRRRYMELFDYLSETYGSTRELSLTALQESLMWANANVACNDVGVV
jgi:hypothetical protein